MYAEAPPKLAFCNDAVQLLFREQLHQHEGQNTAVPVILDLDSGIDAKSHWQRALLSVRVFHRQPDLLSWSNRIGQLRNPKLLRPVKPERLRIRSIEKLQRQHRSEERRVGKECRSRWS